MTTTQTTLYSAFSDTASRYADKPALMYKGEGGKFENVTYRRLDSMTVGLAAALTGLGIERDNKVAIFAYHGPEWVMADLAAARLGAVVVPLYHTLTAESARHILKVSGCRLAFVEGRRLFSKLDGIRGDLPDLETVVVFDPARMEPGDAYLTFGDLLATGEKGVRGGQVPDWPAISPDEIATIIFTSGTTGDPKGVMLSHENILTTAFAGIERFNITSNDVFLSFLPVSHVFEKTCGFYAMLLAGVTIAYAQDLSTITRDIQEIRPTIVIVVPRIIQGAFEAVRRKLRKASPFKRDLITRGTRVLTRYASLKRHGRRIPPGLRLKHFIYDRLVAAKFRNIAGGRIRIMVSGGAPLDKHLEEIVLAMGLNIIEGYGLTEAAPLVSANTVEDNVVGTVGKPFEHLKVRIGEKDEILVRGPNVMKGYYNDPEATAQVIDPDGWLHTGDQGRFDAGGNLIITGRLKELIVTSHGKNIAPFPIESRIRASKYIHQCMLCGDNEKSVTALVVPDRRSIEHFAGEKGLDVDDYASLLTTTPVKNLIAREIEDATGHLADHEKVTRFTLIPEPFAVENDLLTPTLKIRRPKIARRYGDEIAAMY
jgi:long-chain acyl-CoA synthetase